MKELLVAVGGTLALILATFLITWGVIAGLKSYWQAGCEADGYVVQSYGYGLSKNYQCIDPATGNYIDGF